MHMHIKVNKTKKKSSEIDDFKTYYTLPITLSVLNVSMRENLKEIMSYNSQYELEEKSNETCKLKSVSD